LLIAISCRLANIMLLSLLQNVCNYSITPSCTAAAANRVGGAASAVVLSLQLPVLIRRLLLKSLAISYCCHHAAVMSCPAGCRGGCAEATHSAAAAAALSC
jgi:hypothetical protein